MSHVPSNPGPQPLPRDAYRLLSGRQRLLIVLLGVGTAIGVVLTPLAPPGGVVRNAHRADSAEMCSEQPAVHHRLRRDSRRAT